MRSVPRAVRLAMVSAATLVATAGSLLLLPATGLAAGEPTGDLSLEQVLAAVLESSPELAAFQSDVRAAEARMRYAGQWVNPRVSVQVEDALGSGPIEGFSQAQTTVELGQLVEMGGKVRARKAVAGSAVQNASRDYERERIAARSEATSRFVHVLADQHRVALARESVQLAREALAAARKRVSSGAASSVEERRAQVVLARAVIDQEHAEHELLASRRLLGALWGSTEPRFEKAVGDLFARAKLPEYAGVAARVAENPEVRRLASEAALRDAELALAKARAYPDLRVGAGARRLEGPDATAFLASVSVPLPLFSRNRGEIEAAQELRRKLEREQEALRVQLLAEVFAQYQEATHLLTALDMLDKDVLPQAQAVMAATGDGFRLGRLTQLELVEAQRTLMEVRREHIEASEQYHLLIARLEKLIGGPLASAKKGTEKTP